MASQASEVAGMSSGSSEARFREQVSFLQKQLNVLGKPVNAKAAGSERALSQVLDQLCLTVRNLSLDHDRVLSIVEAIEDGLFIVRADYQIEYVSPALERQLGLPAGKKCYQYLQRRDDVCPWCPMQQVAQGKTVRREWTSPVNDRVYEVIDKPLTNPDGSVCKLGILRDITDHKRAEEDLLRQWSINRALVELSNALITPSASIGDIADLVLDYAKQLTGSEHGYVSAIDPETGDNICYTFARMIPDQCSVTPAERGIVFPIGPDGKYPTLWGHALNTRKAFFTNSPGDHPSAKGVPQGHVPIRNFLSTPALIGEELVGQIALANCRDGYSGRDLQVVERLANLYAVAVQRHRSEQALRQTRDGLELRVRQRTRQLADTVQTLRQNEERLRVLFEYAPDAYFLCDLEGRLVDGNRAAERMVGYKRGELIGKRLTEAGLLDDDQIPKVVELLGVSAKGRATGSNEFTMVRKDGSKVVAEIRAFPVRIKGQTLLLGIARDVTQRKAQEQALRRSQSRLAEAQRIAHIGNWDWDVVQNALHWSDEIYRIFGVPPREFGATYDAFLSYVHPKDRDFVKRAVDLALHHRRPYSIEHRIIRPDGTQRTVHERAEVQYDADGNPVRMVGTVQDITERKRLEREVLQAGAAEQQRIGQDLHDGLGQLLAGVSFMSKVLQQKLAARSIPEQQEAANISELVGQAVKQARILAKGLCPIGLGAEGLATALQELAESVRTIFGVSCTLQCPQAVRLNDSSAAAHLYYIAKEATSNAVRHGRAKAICIDLSANRDGDIILRVRDDGVGLPEDVDKSKGLGLHIMRYRAGMVGGNLEVKSDPGGGTTVECVLKNISVR